MSKILCIDTATDICTVSVFENKKCIAIRNSTEDRSHAVQLAVYIESILKETNMQVCNLDAVAISMGPGSYTGLRIGVSMAKGLCYGASIPLIAVSTLQAMCYGITNSFKEQHGLSNFYLCPMLDARRMEVYTSVFNPDYSEVNPVSAEIIDNSSFLDLLEKKPVLFFGNGAEKTKEHIQHKNAIFYGAFVHSSEYMAEIAYNKFRNKQFEDVAYFEPFYLKDFVATIPSKNVFK
jgi:tRNA threonylcarbamoyladenosine biosynthesis protein TsaB